MINMRLRTSFIVLIVFYIEQVQCQCMLENESLRCAKISNLPLDIADAVRGDLLGSVRNIYIAAEPTRNYRQILELNVNSFRLIPNLKQLWISDYSIGRLASNTLSNSSVEHILLNSADIDQIFPGTFMNLPEVQKINLDYNLLKVIPKDVIGNLPKLTHLSLSNNEITFIETSSLEKLPNLRSLILDSNKIDGIVVHQIISHPEQLEILWLNNNSLTMLNNSTLRRLTNLNLLNLRFNRISTIEPNTFEHTPNLQTLVLTHNSLKTVDDDIFPRSGMSSLHVLFLDHNHLMFLSPNLFSRMNGLKKITLVGNPWFCPCLYTIERILHENGIQQKCQGLYVTGMEKVNFSGGEPFLPQRGKHLGEMAKFCKEELKLESVSIVSNGSLIKEKWFKEYGRFVDIMAISCDSFNEDTNKAIGRGQGNRNHIEQLKRVRDWCEKYDVLFKINTVVNTYNHDEDMTGQIREINPMRWKVFQCLLLEGENAGPEALRNAEKFYISEDIFNDFLQRHKDVDCLVPESNTKMQNSYLILDEYMRFLDCTSGSKEPSKSVLDVGVQNALQFSGFDETMFKKRGGIYKWSKEANKLSW